MDACATTMPNEHNKKFFYFTMFINCVILFETAQDKVSVELQEIPIQFGNRTD